MKGTGQNFEQLDRGDTELRNVSNEDGKADHTVRRGAGSASQAINVSAPEGLFKLASCQLRLVQDHPGAAVNFTHCSKPTGSDGVGSWEAHATGTHSALKWEADSISTAPWSSWMMPATNPRGTATQENELVREDRSRPESQGEM